MGANTNGNFNVNDQTHHESRVDQVAGIHVNTAINENTKELSVGTYYSEGGEITSNGVNHFTADQTISKDVRQYSKTSGLGLSGNVKAFDPNTQMNHLIPPNLQSFPITTTDLNFTHQDYQAKVHSVIDGAGPSTHENIGDPIVDAAHQTEVIKNTSHNWHVAIPNLNEGVIQNFKENAAYLHDQLGLNQEDQTDAASTSPPPKDPDFPAHSKEHSHRENYHDNNNGGGDDDEEEVQDPEESDELIHPINQDEALANPLSSLAEDKRDSSKEEHESHPSSRL